MKLNNIYLFVIFFQFSMGEAISIFLIDGESSTPLKGYLIEISPGKIFATSDEDGKVEIDTKSTNFSKKLKITVISGEYSGFSMEIDPSIEEQILMVTGKTTKIKKSKQKVKSLKEFNVRKGNLFSSTLLSKDEIKNSFQVNFNDVVKALQVKAGVSFSGKESTSVLYVQGSPNRNTTFLYEEIEMATSSSRLGEAASMFNPLLMEEVQLHKGGYSTSFFGGTAGVVSLKSLNCDFKKWNLFFGLDNSIEFLANGPLYKDTVSGFVHFRRTLLEVYSKLDSNEDRKSLIDTLPNILDFNSKISAKIGKNGTLNFLANFSMESVSTKDLKKSSKLFSGNNSLENTESKFNHQAWFGIWMVNYQHNISPSTSIFGAIGQTPTINSISRIAINKNTRKEEKTDGVESFRSSGNSYITQFVLKAQHQFSSNQDIDTGIRFHVIPRKFMFNGYFNHFALLPTSNQGKYLTTASQRKINEIGVLVSPHFTHSWSPHPNIFISEGIRLNWYPSNQSGKISGSGYIQLEYRKVPLLRVYQRIGVYSQNVISSYGKILNVTDQSVGPEHSTHIIWGVQSFLKYIVVHVEPFFKYNWNTLFSKNDPGFDNSGESYNAGFSLSILQVPSPTDFIHISLGYMYIFSKEKVNFRTPASTDNFYQYRTYLIAPKVGKWTTPSHIRDHSFAINTKITPFIKLMQRPKIPSWIKNPSFSKQSFSFQFILLTGSPYTPGESVIKRMDATWPNLFTYQIIPGEYHSLKTPNIYKLDMKYSIPIRKKSEFFISFLNLLNLKNEYLLKNIATKEITESTIPPGTYGKDKIETFGQSSVDSGIGKGYFSIRFGCNIWLEIQNKTIKLS